MKFSDKHTWPNRQSQTLCTVHLIWTLSNQKIMLLCTVSPMESQKPENTYHKIAGFCILPVLHEKNLVALHCNLWTLIVFARNSNLFSLKRWIFCWIQQRADQQNRPKTLTCWIADIFNFYRYIAHLYWLTVQAGSYSDVIVLASHAESRGFDPQPGQIRRYFSSPVTFGAQRKQPTCALNLHESHFQWFSYSQKFEDEF